MLVKESTFESNRYLKHQPCYSVKIIENIKLFLRANKYKNKDDKGGIAYINATIKKGQTVFDIGAHKAGYLFWMLQQVGNEGKVFAFEPQKNLYQYLYKIKALFHWENVVVEHIALSDKEEEVTLFIPANKVSKGSSPGASIVKHNEFFEVGATENVFSISLDVYCKQKNIQPNFLKIDVEGNELNVFKGGVETLKIYKPKIFVEIEARHIGKEKVVETFNFLQTLGYQGKFVYGLAYKPLSEFDFEKYQNTEDKNNYCNNFIFE